MLGPNFAYTDALNELTNEYNKKQRETGADISKFPLRPSAAGQCERELAYALMEYRGLAKYEKELLKPETTRIFSLGHSVEYVLLRDFAERFKEIGFTVDYKQQRLSFMKLQSSRKPEWSQWIEGSIDFCLMSKDHKGIGDVKSKKDKYSSYRASQWLEDNEKYSKMNSLTKFGDAAFYADNAEEFLNELGDPFIAANVLQLNLYACNSFIAERDIDHCFLIYYNKNTSEIREIRWRPSLNLDSYVKQKFTNAFEAVEGGDPVGAKQEYPLGSMKCAFCNYKAECRGDSDPLKAWFKTFPKKSWPTDTSKLESLGEELEASYSDYKMLEGASKEEGRLGEAIATVMAENKIQKIRFSDGEVYEAKLLKSPREHLELRRSKT
jgi:hypothetical protein